MVALKNPGIRWNFRELKNLMAHIKVHKNQGNTQKNHKEKSHSKPHSTQFQM
jgi:hypothetical protein